MAKYSDVEALNKQYGIDMSRYAQRDLDLARLYPEYGMELTGYVNDYNTGKTKQQKEFAHQQAEALRSQYANDAFLNAMYANNQTLSSFNDKDIELAAANPDYGVSLVTLRNQWRNAKTDEEKQNIHNQTNALRSSYGNYTALGNGSQYVIDSKEDIDAKNYLDKVMHPEEFNFNEWMRNGGDQMWNAYVQQANLGLKGNVAKYAGQNGGGYASNGMAAAQGQYDADLANFIPTVYNQAYSEHLQKLQNNVTALNAIRDQQNYEAQKADTAYQRAWNESNRDYERAWNEDQRNYERNQYADETTYNRSRDAIADARYADETAYNRKMTEDEIAYNRQRDAVSDARYADETAYQRNLTERSYQDTKQQNRVEELRQVCAEAKIYTKEYADAIGHPEWAGLAYPQPGDTSSGSVPTAYEPQNGGDTKDEPIDKEPPADAPKDKKVDDSTWTAQNILDNENILATKQEIHANANQKAASISEDVGNKTNTQNGTITYNVDGKYYTAAELYRLKLEGKAYTAEEDGKTVWHLK